MEPGQSNLSTNSHFLLDRLLIYGYAHENSSKYIPFDVACLIINYYGRIWNNCSQVTISVPHNYIFDDEICNSLWDDYNTSNMILQFKWNSVVPTNNITILQKYEKQYGVKQWIIDCSDTTITFLPFVIGTIDKLLSVQTSKPGTLAHLTEKEMTELCKHTREVFLSQAMLLELEPPITIIGDLHGAYFDLLRIFEHIGYPPETNYLCLGNYVDRGKQSIETVSLLLCYKLLYPEIFFMLRGNHECRAINRYAGFYNECKRRYTARLWKRFVDVFNCLPVAAIIADKIFCVHGGISPELKHFDQIKRMKRPTDVPDSGLLCDLLWSDPEMIYGWGESDRGVSYIFGPDVTTAFCNRFDIDLICRSLQILEDGYEFFADRRLVTIYSAPNYMGEFDNAGAVMSVDQSLKCKFVMFKPTLN